MRLGSHVVLAEVGLTLLEALLVSAPAVALAGKSIAASGEVPRFLPLLGAVLFVSWVRSDYSLRPVLAARNAKERGQALTDAELARADRAIARAPVEGALVRWAIWTAAAIVLAVRLVTHGQLPWASGLGVACIGFLHAGGVAALRALVWERVLERPRRTVLPNFDPLRAFARIYRRRLAFTAAALLASAHAVNAALVAVFTELTSNQAGILLALTVPALVVPMVFWYASLAKRTQPIEAYFDAAVRRPGLRGPTRDDPGAIAAFLAGQALPYRLAGYQALACAFAAVAVVVLGRRLGGFDAATAGRLLGAMGLMIIAMGLYETLLAARRAASAARAARLAAPPARLRGALARRAAHEARRLLRQRSSCSRRGSCCSSCCRRRTRRASWRGRSRSRSRSRSASCCSSCATW